MMAMIVTRLENLPTIAGRTVVQDTVEAPFVAELPRSQAGADLHALLSFRIPAAVEQPHELSGQF